MASKSNYSTRNRGFVEIAQQSESAPTQSLRTRISVIFYLLALMAITGYMAVVILGAHHLQHEVRDLVLTDQKPVTAARFINYIKQKNSLDQQLLEALDELRFGSKNDEDDKENDKNDDEIASEENDIQTNNLIEIDNLEALNRAYTYQAIRKSAWEKLRADSLTSTAGSESGLDATDTTSNEAITIQSNFATTQAKVRTELEAIEAADKMNEATACLILNSVYAAENAFHRGWADLLADNNFGSEVSRIAAGLNSDGIVVVDEGGYLGDFSNIYSRIKNQTFHNGPCPLPILLKAQTRLTLDDPVIEPLASYAYFTRSKESSNAFRRFLDRFFQKTVEMPRQTLTVMLVLIMGALGGAVDLLRRFLDTTQKLSFENFIFMPILGMISGFAIFVLVKSGVLLIAEPNAGQQGAMLSPYFVAFLGLISGLLAKEAVDSILSVGRKFFQHASDDVQRYYIGDVTKADDIDGTVRPIANLANISNDRVTAYLKGDIPTPGPLQMLISNQTGQPRRNIFTDLSPLQDITDETVPGDTATPTPSG